MKIVLLVSLIVISFILSAQKTYPKIHINSSIIEKGEDGKWKTWVTHAVINQKAFRISLTHQLTGKYHADHIEKLAESKWQTITIVDNRRMDMNFNSSRAFLKWIKRHGYEAKYSESSGAYMSFTFKRML